MPLIWGAANVNAGTLSQVRGEGPYLLGFNEPDMSGQANMTPARALSLWPQLMATGLKLGSPAVASGGATPGGWLDQFMSGAQARGYRVNFITLHWYGGDFATGPAVSQLESYPQAVHARYHKPIWLTEFALANFGWLPADAVPGAAGRVPHGGHRDAGAAGPGVRGGRLRARPGGPRAAGWPGVQAVPPARTRPVS